MIAEQMAKTDVAVRVMLSQVVAALQKQLQLGGEESEATRWWPGF